ncbi:class I histocompatibility antigen, F10 alpha chain-like [Aulostomus maculatus]
MLALRLLLACLLPLVTSSGSGQHSLWALASFISGSSPFPEFSVVLMLDDIQVGYFDSASGRLTRRGGEEVELDVGQEAVFVLRDISSSMRRRLSLVKNRFNLTDGLHVQQRLTGCEVQDGQPALIMFRDGSNGRDADSLMYNMTHFTYMSGEGWEIQWDAMKKTYFQMLYSNIYLPFCLRTLTRLLDLHKHLVTRRVPPRVRLFTRQVAGGALVTCLATDFYPRHINLSLLRDGCTVGESQLTGGVVLPNANGLYQVRKTLLLSDEELRQKHNYTCAATHLSLDNRLQVSWRAEFSHSHRTHVVPPAVLTAAAAAVLLLLLWCRRRPRGTRGGRHGDTSQSEGVAMETRKPPGKSQL